MRRPTKKARRVALVTIAVLLIVAWATGVYHGIGTLDVRLENLTGGPLTDIRLDGVPVGNLGYRGVGRYVVPIAKSIKLQLKEPGGLARSRTYNLQFKDGLKHTLRITLTPPRDGPRRYAHRQATGFSYHAHSWLRVSLHLPLERRPG